jgi:hypothetical protein
VPGLSGSVGPVESVEPGIACHALPVQLFLWPLRPFFHVFQQLDPGTLKALGHHQGILVGAWNLGGSDVYRWAMIWKKKLKAGERVKTVGNQNYFRNTLESCPNFSKFQAVGCESTDMTCPSWTGHVCEAFVEKAHLLPLDSTAKRPRPIDDIHGDSMSKTCACFPSNDPSHSLQPRTPKL